jgi:hypothetical protein
MNTMQSAPEPAKVVEGKDGWLFLAHDTNDVLGQHTGRVRFSPRELRGWRHVLETRISWLRARGIPYFFLVPPNTHSVYSEYLPDDVVPVAERPVQQLIAHLRDTESEARLIYPVEELVAHKERDLVYIPTDSHWNDLGAFIAYKALLREIAGVIDVRDVAFEKLVWSRPELVGDLGSKITPPRQSTEIILDVEDWTAEYTEDNRVQVRGRRIEYRSAAAPDVTCLVHGDSYSEKLLHFMGESFGRLVFCQMPSLDYSVVREVRPDVVVGVLNERFLLHVPYDATAPTQAELEAAKRAAGLLYPPRAAGLPPRVDSLDTAEDG